MRAEIERLRHVVCTRCPDEAQAEIERLRAMLREAAPFINDAGNDEDPEAQARANELFARIADALAGKEV